MEKAQEMLEGYDRDKLESGFSKLEGCSHSCATCVLNAATEKVPIKL